jgi:hypothetical protein
MSAMEIKPGEPLRLPINTSTDWTRAKVLKGWSIEVYVSPDAEGIVADIALIDPNGDRLIGSAIDIFHADELGTVATIVDTTPGDPAFIYFAKLEGKEGEGREEWVWLDDETEIGKYYGKKEDAF